jgi:glycerophosphoryl diester phosphodiesterase
MIQNKPIVIVGHKGAAGYAPGNTLASFEKAIEIGCDRAELDVRLTSDNVVVVIHDDDISITSDSRGLVSDMTLAEVKRAKVFENETIPTLQEVVDLCSGKILLQIELKAVGTPSLVNELVIKNNLTERVVITSFNLELLSEIRRLNRNLIIGLLFSNAIDQRLLKKIINETPLNFIGPYSEIISKSLVDFAHSLNNRVYAYRVNNLSLGNTLIEMGVDELGTDYPKLFLDKKNT